MKKYNNPFEVFNFEFKPGKYIVCIIWAAVVILYMNHAISIFYYPQRIRDAREAVENYEIIYKNSLKFKRFVCFKERKEFETDLVARRRGEPEPLEIGLKHDIEYRKVDLYPFDDIFNFGFIKETRVVYRAERELSWSSFSGSACFSKTCLPRLNSFGEEKISIDECPRKFATIKGSTDDHPNRSFSCDCPKEVGLYEFNSYHIPSLEKSYTRDLLDFQKKAPASLAYASKLVSVAEGHIWKWRVLFWGMTLFVFGFPFAFGYYLEKTDPKYRERRKRIEEKLKLFDE